MVRTMLLCVCLLLAGCTAPGIQPEVQVQPGLVDGFYRCIRVVDGDTIELDNVGTVRFVDIDAPEPDEPGGPEAKQALAELIEGEVVFVTFKRKRNGQPVRCYYGRPLVWLTWPPAHPPDTR